MKIEEENSGASGQSGPQCPTGNKGCIEVEGFPNFIKLRVDDEIYIVTTLSGKTYEFKDISTDKMLRVEKRAVDPNGNFNMSNYQLMMISEMTGITEEDLKNLKASTFGRLRIAMMRILGMDSFLSEKGNN